MQGKRMGWVLALALILVALCLAGPPASAQDGVDAPQKKVTFSYENVRVEEVLSTLFEQAGVSYALSPEAQKIATGSIVSITMMNSPFKVALDNVMRTAPLAYRVENGIYTILAKPGAVVPKGEQNPPPFAFPSGVSVEDALMRKKIDFEVKDAELLPALRKLFNLAKLEYAVVLLDDGAEKITLSMKNAPFNAVLEAILHSVKSAAPLAYRYESGVVYVGSQPDRRPMGGPTEKKVTLAFHNADLRYALKLLFGSVHGNYSLDQTVGGAVMAKLTGVPFRVALETILRAVGDGKGRYTYTVENGVYRITSKTPEGFIE